LYRQKEEKNMNTYVLSFQEIDRTKFMVAGGKGANQAKLSDQEIRCRKVFDVTTEAYKK